MDQWKYVKYARRGLKHIQDSQRIQSSAEIKENGHALAAVVCKGIESLSFSEVAASEVASGVCTALLRFGQSADQFDPQDEEQVYQLKSQLVQEARKIIRSKAKSIGIDREQMDCTLSFVLILKDLNQAITGNLGSSVIGLIRQSDARLIAAGTDAAELSVSSEYAADEMQLQHFDLNDGNLTGFLITTKGLENEIYSRDSSDLKTNAQKYINALFEQNPEGRIDSYVSALTSRNAQQYQDDICLAVLGRMVSPVSLKPATWLCVCGSRNLTSYKFCKKCGTDFNVLYKGIDFDKFGGKDNIFRNLNNDPVQEMAFLEQAAAKAGLETKKNSPSSTSSFENSEMSYDQDPMAFRPAAPAMQQAPSQPVQSSKQWKDTNVIRPQQSVSEMKTTSSKQWKDTNVIRPGSQPSVNSNKKESGYQDHYYDSSSFEAKEKGGLNFHAKLIAILGAVVACILIAVIAVVFIRSGSDTSQNTDNNSTEIDQSGNDQGSKPIHFH